ncbi:hypothetical protein F1B92_07600 [Campylobacter sp. FMV-PI01]|uniref:Dynamin N-terminal domain-containing protein n=1 Tax=Campylobacter portucalensis TaxID=2608384 RepID=A0A6L5WMG7_9BACT|nr:dynamin family protein [Campylobacter portucalensis]MSN97023.1 hypothetical protein [Campylobacter portucalensis]
MLDEFIKEYKEKFLKEYRSCFWGRVDRVCSILLDPKNHASFYLKNRLKHLMGFENKPLEIAVVGQFSSGKSTFLNSLFKSNLLPTGVVPVTAKVIKIKYCSFEMIKIKHLNGLEEILEITNLSNFVDQRLNLKSIQSIEIYANIDILKKFTFLDTPGLNSININDTNEAIAILNDACSIVWISLIDNAARSSEKDGLNLVSKSVLNNSICLLSQKDRLSNAEIDRVLEYSKDVFKDYFKNIVAISSKEENMGLKNSGFDEFINFLDKIYINKNEIIKDKFIQIINLLKDEREFYIKFYNDLMKIIEFNLEKILNNLDDNLKIYLYEFEKIYANIKEISNSFSTIFENSIKIEKGYFLVQKKGFLNKNSYEKVVYEFPNFNKDFAFSKMIYNNDGLIFRRLKSKSIKLRDEILSNLNLNYNILMDEILLFKAKFETYQKKSQIHSTTQTSKIQKLASEVYEFILKDYENKFQKISQKIMLFFEKVDIKIISNYENSILLTGHYVSDRILNSINAYKSDPLTFSIFYPNFNDFNENLLKNLHYYEFEDDFLAEKSFIKKCIIELKEQLNINLQKNRNFLINHIDKHKEILKELDFCIGIINNESI